MSRGRTTFLVSVLFSLILGGVSGAGTSMYLLTSGIVEVESQESVNTTVGEVYTEESKIITAYDKV